LPVDGPLVHTRRPSLRPNGTPLFHVPQILLFVDDNPDVGQRSLPRRVIPDLSIHQNTVMIEQYEFLHPN
jgi:hypothetical protein